MRKCIKCGIINENDDHEHHIIPLGLGGKDIDGRDILCRKHHEEFHKRHYGLMMEIVRESPLKEEAIKRTKDYYCWWIKNG
jgi:hypothetical protein